MKPELIIKFTTPLGDSKVKTEKYIMAMYGKPILEFARGLEQAKLQHKKTESTKNEEEANEIQTHD